MDFAISPDDLTIEKTPTGARHAIVEILLVAYDRDERPTELEGRKSRYSPHPQSIRGPPPCESPASSGDGRSPGRFLRAYRCLRFELGQSWDARNSVEQRHCPGVTVT